MQKMKLGIVSEDQEYRIRFVNCLMNHFRDKFEIHVFSSAIQWLEQGENQMELLLVSDLGEDQMQELVRKALEIQLPVVELRDQELEQVREWEGVILMDKYQEVNRIVDQILQQIGEEIRVVQRVGEIPVKTRIAAVYALSDTEYQLPFAVTMASIFSENEKVLILDLQENSGLTHLVQQQEHLGLEDVFIMAEGENFSRARMLSSIGHLEKVDYVYPVRNSECLCEADAATYLCVLKMLIQELDYSLILLNLGTRFQGFFEVLNKCQEIYLMQRRGGLAQWRSYEFMEEITGKGYESLTGRIAKIELPITTSDTVSCERLVEQWKWGELGDMIRHLTMGAAQVG